MYRIGIDLGGTKTESILLDSAGETLLRERVPTPPDGTPDRYRAIVSTIADLVRRTAAKIPDSNAYTLGMGIPGIVDGETGLVHNANTTCLIDHPLQEDLEAELNHPIAVQNDANCFTMAECRMGAGRGYGLVWGVIMGTGCGGGLYIGAPDGSGEVRRGPHGISGEWGHMSLDPQGVRCWCGNTGCVETLISGSGVERDYEQRHGEKRRMADIVAAAREGRDERAVDSFERFLRNFGRALGGIISALDPDAVVLGGGLSNVEELYTRGARYVREAAFHRNLRTPILRNELGDSAGVFGAAWIGV